MSQPIRIETFVSRFFLFAIALACSVDSTCAQDAQQFLTDGEFSCAIDAAGENDSAIQQVAQAQLANGDGTAALRTIGRIRDGKARTNALNLMQFSGDGLSSGSGTSGSERFSGGGSMTGTMPNGGGITAADFSTLMQLIQGTVSADSWETNGSGNGTMFPYPTGVYVDAEGILNRTKTSKRKLTSTEDFRDQMLPRVPVQKHSDMRKVSLTRLERAVQLRAAQGKAPTETMRCLAGLTQVRYVMIDPDSGEVIIAGPAGDWNTDGKGKSVSVVDQQPVLSLDDFVVCLRNAFKASGKFGCAIVPRKANLAATKQYISNTKGSGKKWENGLRDALGQQDIDVFGIPSNCHAARVLVEADYHMKLIGMGIEPTIPSVPSYLDRVKLDADGNPPPMDVVRWWFALNYERLFSNEAKTLFEFRGPGVKVLAETEFINNDGDRIHTGKAVGPTSSFARDFTKSFATLAEAYPIYNELKNIFDLAIVANLIREHELANKAGWQMPFFVSTDDEKSKSWQTEKFKAADSVDSVINRHIIRDRRDGETMIHTLIGVSGGVSFDPAEFVSRKNAKVERDIEFTGQLPAAIEDMPSEPQQWWWD